MAEVPGRSIVYETSAAAVAGLLLLAGCSGGGEGEPGQSPSPAASSSQPGPNASVGPRQPNASQQTAWRNEAQEISEKTVDRICTTIFKAYVEGDAILESVPSHVGGSEDGGVLMDRISVPIGETVLVRAEFGVHKRDKKILEERCSEEATVLVFDNKRQLESELAGYEDVPTASVTFSWYGLSTDNDLRHPVLNKIGETKLYDDRERESTGEVEPFTEADLTDYKLASRFVKDAVS